jgi:hypothetical protein
MQLVTVLQGDARIFLIRKRWGMETYVKWKLECVSERQTLEQVSRLWMVFVSWGLGFWGNPGFCASEARVPERPSTNGIPSLCTIRY